MAGAGMRRNQIGGTDGLVSHAEPGARLRRFSVPAAYTPPCAIQMRECGPISTTGEADATSNARMRQSGSCWVRCAAETRSFSTRLQIPAQYGFCQFPDSLAK